MRFPLRLVNFVTRSRRRAGIAVFMLFVLVALPMTRAFDVHLVASDGNRARAIDAEDPGRGTHSALHALARVQQMALTAPRSSKGRCVKTVHVPGQGPSCLDRSGLWRVKSSAGEFTTHGPDAIPSSTAVEMAKATATVARAGRLDVQCVDIATRRYTALVYAYPRDRPNRGDRIAPLLRTELYRASAFLEARARSGADGAHARIQAQCDASGEARVFRARLATGSAGTTIATINSDLRSLGYNAVNSRYLIFYDAPIAAGYAGQAYLYADDRATSENLSNTSGMIAVQYAYGDALPHWFVLLHETSHNAGAVQDSSPHASGSGHCNDGRDVMCYSDGGAAQVGEPYSSDVCATSLFDCGRNDYFNVEPRTGSYLASHWNLASGNNLYLDTESDGSSLVDSTPPTAPGRITVTRGSTGATFRWLPATDGRGVVRYSIWYVREGDRPYLLVGGTRYLRKSVARLSRDTSFTIAIAAHDAAGNRGPFRRLSFSTDMTVPTPPTSQWLQGSSRTTLNVAWSGATDNVAVNRYQLFHATSTGWRSLGTTQLRTFWVGSLQPGTRHRFLARAFDAAGNISVDSRAWTMQTQP